MPVPAFSNQHQPEDYSSLSVVTTHVDGLVNQNATPSPIASYDFLVQFDELYAPIHAYLSAIISVAGVFCNMLTIIILSRPEMCTPTNRLYAVMAFADLITMFLYSIFAIFFQIAYPPSDRGNLSELRAIFMVIYADLSIFVHTLSISILVAVTVFRVLILKLPGQSSKQYCSLERAHWSAFIVLILCILITLPNIYITSWRKTPEFWEVYQREDELSQATSIVNFWFQAIFVKLLPCLLLTLASIAIVRTLKEAEARRKRLQGKKHDNGALGGKSQPSDPRIRNRTLMLLALLVVFLLTEFPQGILTLVCGIMGEAIWTSIYMPLGNFMDMLTLINAGFNFVLFASMSSEFRAALNKQLSTWFVCYARMLEEKKQQQVAAKSTPQSVVTTVVAPARSECGDASAMVPLTGAHGASQHSLASAAAANVSQVMAARDPSAISSLIIADLENWVDGELVVKRSKSSSKQPSSRSSSTSSAKKDYKLKPLNSLDV